jgi:hypothetical protein
LPLVEVLDDAVESSGFRVSALDQPQPVLVTDNSELGTLNAEARLPA